MAAGTKADMVFGAIKIAQLARLLQAVSLRLRQSLRTARSLSVLLLWLPRVASVFSEGLRQRLRVAASLLQLSLSPMEPRLLLLRLQLQQAVSALLLALLRLVRRALRRLLPTSSPTRRRALRRLLPLRAKAALSKAQALRRLRSLQSPLPARSSGSRSLGPVIPGRFRAPHPQHIHNRRRPAQAGNRRRED